MKNLLEALMGRTPGERVDAAIVSEPTPPPERIPGPPPTAIAVKEVPEDVPEFKREYSARLDHRAVIKIDARTWAWGRRYGGELTQPNGRRVWFEPERIADKILDPALVPLVEKAVRQIIAMDEAYMATKPDRFTDEKRQVWVRA
jgi:hypothetical protein